jgi:hypothetical protein
MLRSLTRPRVKVLFIGNSYTFGNDLPTLIAQIAEAAGEPARLDATMIAVGGATLKDHWNTAATRAAVQQGQWDYVVLQEQSQLPIVDPAEMHRYVRLFDQEIRRAGAKTVLFLTWARQDAPASQQSLTDAYMRIGRELRATVAPVGPAWQRARVARPSLELYEPDQSHPSLAGSYLAACVFYATIYHKSPAGVANTAGSALPDADAAALQRVAWETVSSAPANSAPSS